MRETPPEETPPRPNEGAAVQLVLDPSEWAALQYVVPIWNARRALDQLPPQAADEVLGELLCVSLWEAVRGYRRDETVQLGALMATATEAQRELVRKCLGMAPAPAPQPKLIEARLRETRASDLDRVSEG